MIIVIMDLFYGVLVEKDKIKEYERKKYQEVVQYKKEVLKNK